MSIPRLALKIAAELIEQRLLEQQMEPADQPQMLASGQEAPAAGGVSALRFLRSRSRPAATEPAPKIVSTTGGRNR